MTIYNSGEHWDPINMESSQQTHSASVPASYFTAVNENGSAEHEYWLKNSYFSQPPPITNGEVCKVCGDFASGTHFGVLTCEGCKGFYKRNHKEGDSKMISTLTCSRNKKCEITPNSRNSCRYCRYNKCIEVGMSRKAIKLGRRSKKDRVCLKKDLEKASKANRAAFNGLYPPGLLFPDTSLMTKHVNDHQNMVNCLNIPGQPSSHPSQYLFNHLDMGVAYNNSLYGDSQFFVPNLAQYNQQNIIQNDKVVEKQVASRIGEMDNIPVGTSSTESCCYGDVCFGSGLQTDARCGQGTSDLPKLFGSSSQHDLYCRNMAQMQRMSQDYPMIDLQRNLSQSSVPSYVSATTFTNNHSTFTADNSALKLSSCYNTQTPPGTKIINNPSGVMPNHEPPELLQFSQMAKANFRISPPGYRGLTAEIHSAETLPFSLSKGAANFRSSIFDNSQLTDEQSLLMNESTRLNPSNYPTLNHEVSQTYADIYHK